MLNSCNIEAQSAAGIIKHVAQLIVNHLLSRICLDKMLFSVNVRASFSSVKIVTYLLSFLFSVEQISSATAA